MLPLLSNTPRRTGSVRSRSRAESDRPARCRLGAGFPRGRGTRWRRVSKCADLRWALGPCPSEVQYSPWAGRQDTTMMGTGSLPADRLGWPAVGAPGGLGHRHARHRGRGIAYAVRSFSHRFAGAVPVVENLIRSLVRCDPPVVVDVSYLIGSDECGRCTGHFCAVSQLECGNSWVQRGDERHADRSGFLVQVVGLFQVRPADRFMVAVLEARPSPGAQPAQCGQGEHGVAADRQAPLSDFSLLSPLGFRGGISGYLRPCFLLLVSSALLGCRVVAASLAYLARARAGWAAVDK